MSAIYGNVRKFKDGITFIQQLDKELTQVSIVTGQTREQTAGLAQEYAKLGKEMGKTVSEISAVNTELVRQGLSLEESQNRLMTVMKLNAVSDVDMNPTETLKVITSSVNALKTEAETAADVILKASTISASSVGEIGDALTKTASSAQATGLKIEQVSSIISTLEEVTQESSSSLGNSVKTLLARFNKVDEETGGLNKNLNDVQKAFESVGVTFTEADGSIRSFYDLMTDLNTKGFKDMDKNTKSYVANMAAGVRQQNRFIALADNWSRVVDIQDELVDSAGTLDQAYGQWLNSTEASANRAKIALEQMWINTINSDAIKGFYELSTAITTIIDKLGAMNVAVFVLSTIMLKGNNSVRRFLMNLSQLPSLMSISIAEMGLFKGSLFALGTAMDITALKGKLMWGAITLGASFAITKAIEGITKLINKQSELKHSNEELALNYKNTVSDINNKQQRLSELGSSYDTIRKKIDGHIDLSESEKSILKEITDMFPDLIKGYDNQGNAIIDTTKSVDGLNDSLEKLLDIERRAFLEGSNDIFKETEKDIKKAQQAIEDINYELKGLDVGIDDGVYYKQSIQELEEGYTRLAKAKGEDNKQTIKAKEAYEQAKTDRERYVNSLEQETQKTDEAIAKRKEVAITVAEVMSEYKKMPNVLKNIVQEQINEINMMDISADEMTKKVQDLVKSLSNNKLNTAILDYDGLVRQYKLGELTAEQFDKAVQELIKTLLTIEGIDKDLITRLFPESNNIKSIADDTLDLTTYFQVMGGVVSDAVDEYELLNNALYELQTEGHLSRATLDELLKIFPNLIEQTGLQKDELIKLINTQKDARVETINSQIAQTKATMEGVWQRITGYQTEIEAMKAVAEARKALAGIEAWDSGIRTGDPELDAYMENKYGEARATIHRAEIATIEMDKLKNKLSGLQGMKNWFGDADKSYKDKLDKYNKKNKKKEKKKDKPNFIDPIDAEIRAIQSKNDNIEKSNELLREQLDLAKDIEGIEGLNKQYEINGKLIENNKKLLKSYKDEQTSLHDKANNLRNKNKKYNIDSWFDANGEQTQAYVNQYDKLSKKEQENMDKVFIQMQKYKKSWMETNKEIKNTNDSLRELNLNKITTQFEIADAKLKSLTDSFADLEYQSQLLADDDYTGKADNTAQKIGNLKAQVEQAKKELEELNKSYKNGEINVELYTQRQEELNQRIKDGTLKLKQEEENKKQNIIDRYNAEFELMDKRLNKEKEYEDSLNKQLQKIELMKSNYKNINDYYDDLINKNKEILASNHKQSQEAKNSLNVIQEQMKGLQTNTEEWELLNEQAKKYKNEIEDTNLQILQLANNIAKLNIDKLLDPFNKYKDDLQYQIDLLGNVNTDIEREDLNRLSDNIASVLEAEKYAIQDRLDEIKIDLLNNLDEESILSLTIEQEELNKKLRETNVNLVATKDKLEQLALDKLKRDLDNITKSLEKFIKQREYLQYLLDFQNIVDDKNYDSIANITRKIIDSEKAYMDAIKNQLNSLYVQRDALKENSDEWDIINNKIEEMEKNLKQSNLSILELSKKYATSKIQKQIDDITKSIEKQREAEEKRYNDVKKHLDDELSKYKEVVQARMDALKEEAEMEDFNKTFIEEQQKAAEIRRKIQLLSLNNSLESQSKIRELQDELSEQEKKIIDMANKKIRDARIKGLEKNLDDFEKSIEESSKQNDRLKEITETKINMLDNILERLNQSIQNFVESMAEFLNNGAEGKVPQFTPARFDTGGYTGTFGSKGKLAVVDEKELILNKFDSKNILDAVKINRDILKIPSFSANNISKKLAGTNGITMNVYVDNMVANNKKHVQNVFTQIKDGLNGLGYK